MSPRRDRSSHCRPVIRQTRRRSRWQVGWCDETGCRQAQAYLAFARYQTLLQRECVHTFLSKKEPWWYTVKPDVFANNRLSIKLLSTQSVSSIVSLLYVVTILGETTLIPTTGLTRVSKHRPIYLIIWLLVARELTLRSNSLMDMHSLIITKQWVYASCRRFDYIL